MTTKNHQESRVDKQELLNKLAQIEEHAKSGLAEFPQLSKERLRMITALARYLRTELSASPDAASEAGVRASRDDHSNARSG